MGGFFCIRLYQLFKHYFWKQNILIIAINCSCSHVVLSNCDKMIRIILGGEAMEFSIKFETELSDRSCNKNILNNITS